MLVLTALPEKCHEICEIFLSEMSSSAGRDKFPRYQEAAPPHVLHKSLRTPGAVSLLQPPSLVKTLKRLLVIPRVREGLTFPIGSRGTSRGALCPLHLLRFAQLKWDKAHGGLWIFTGE